jgi:hypothetical protein
VAGVILRPTRRLIQPSIFKAERIDARRTGARRPFVEAWNEPDAAKRSSATAALWAPDAPSHNGTRGYATLTRLMLAAPAKNAAREGVRFRAAPSARLRGDVVTFRWEMLLGESETVLASGLEFLIVDGDGRILVDHPFAAG